MDTYAEQLVVKTPTSKEKTNKTLLIAGTAIIVLIILYFSLTMLFAYLPMGLLLAGGAIYGAYYLSADFYVEYEYLVTNGEMDIDKIMGKKNRTRMITAKVSTFESFGTLDSAPEAKGSITTVKASDGTEKNAYYADFKSEEHGDVRLVFSPNENTLNALKPYLPRKCR